MIKTDKKSRIPLTKSRIDQLKREIKRTGVGAASLVKTIPKRPKEITGGLIYRWLNGDVKTAKPDIYEYVLQSWKSLPSFHDVYIPLTPVVLNLLQNQRERTDVGIASLLSQQADRPADLDDRAAQHIYGGRLTKVKKEHLDYILRKWEELPDSQFIPLTKDIIKTLQSHRKRTGVGPHRILRGSMRDIPEGLNGAIIRQWLTGEKKSVRKDHLDYVLKRWEGVSEDERLVDITDDVREKFIAERQRTQASPEILFSTLDHTPRELTPSIVRGWMTGAINKAQKRHLDFVLDKWTNLPARKSEDGNITPEIFAHILEEKKRTGLGASTLLKNRIDAPEGLTANVINSWLSGKVTNARQDHIDFVLKRFKDGLSEGDFIILTSDILEKLRMHSGPSGFLPGRIFKGAENVPFALNPSMISRWLAGNARKARKEHVEYVLKKCAEIENSDTRPIHITDEIWRELDYQRNRTKMGPGVLFRNLENIPDGLKSVMVQGWLNKTSRTTRKDYVDFILKSWSEIPTAEFRPAPIRTIMPDADMPFILTEERIKILHDEIARIDLQLPTLLRKFSSKLENLDYETVSGWLNRTKNTGEEKQYKALLKLLKLLPDKQQNHTTITESILYVLYGHQVRTGISLKKLLENRTDMPEGLNIKYMIGVMKGISTSARQDHINYIIQQWEKLPDKIYRIPITRSILFKLEERMAACGFIPPEILHNDQCPDGLTISIIESWLKGQEKSARRDYLDFVLEQWQEYKNFKETT